MDGNKRLPEELVEEILVRLPATSLIRFRCVSKSWLSLISSNGFVRRHLNFNNSHHFNSVALISSTECRNGYFDSVFSVSSSPRDEDQVMELKLREAIGIGIRINNGHDNRISILGHCDGLLLVALNSKVKGIDFNIIAVWNPSINKYKTLPLPNGFHFLSLIMLANEAFGMGYDSSIDDYKVVRISTYDPFNPRPPKVDVLTLKTNKWRTIEFVLLKDDVLNINKCDIVFSMRGQFLCHKNTGFFCTDDCEYTLLHFDLAEEKFQVIPTPPHRIFDTQPLILRSMGLPATLCFEYKCKYEELIEVWIAKHETSRTWIRLVTMPTTLVQRNHRLLCFTQFGKVLFLTKDHEFAIYDPQQNSVKKLAIHHGVQHSNLSDHAFPYIHSLVCP